MNDNTDIRDLVSPKEKMSRDLDLNQIVERKQQNSLAGKQGEGALVIEDVTNSDQHEPIEEHAREESVPTVETPAMRPAAHNLQVGKQKTSPLADRSSVDVIVSMNKTDPQREQDGVNSLDSRVQSRHQRTLRETRKNTHKSQGEGSQQQMVQ